MIITTKYASTCPKCSRPIAAGSKAEWEHGAKASHVDCGAASPAPTRGPAKAARPAAFPDRKPKPGAITTTRRELPSKRHLVPSYVGETRRLDDRAAAEHGCRYYVVETQSAVYVSAEANEDNGDFDGACWWVTLGGRPATQEEAAVADRAHQARHAAATAEVERKARIAELVSLLRAGGNTGDVAKPVGLELVVNPGARGSGVEIVVLADDGAVSLWWSGVYDDFRRACWTVRSERAVELLALLGVARTTAVAS